MHRIYYIILYLVVKTAQGRVDEKEDIDRLWYET